MNPRDKTLEAFAPAQFLEMSDAEKLDAPSFEPTPSGKAIDGPFELKIMLPATVAIQFIKESKRQNIKTEFLIGKVLERLSRVINEARDNKTRGL